MTLFARLIWLKSVKQSMQTNQTNLRNPNHINKMGQAANLTWPTHAEDQVCDRQDIYRLQSKYGQYVNKL